MSGFRDFADARGEDGVDVQRELAFALRLIGRPAEALALYDATIERFPNHVLLRIERGWVLVQELGNATQAKSDFEAALARQPENAEAYAGAGYCAACQKKPDEARRFAASSLLYGAGDYLNIHNVACIYSRLFREFRDEQAHDDDTAVRMIQRELELWKRRGGTAPDAEVLVRQESEFRVLGL